MTSMPERICRSMHSSTARSSTRLKAASDSFPPANWSRASFRYAGRKRLPTTSLRYTVPSTVLRLQTQARRYISLAFSSWVTRHETGITVIQVQGDYKWKLLCRWVVCCEVAGYFCVPFCGYFEVPFTNVQRAGV